MLSKLGADAAGVQTMSCCPPWYPPWPCDSLVGRMQASTPVLSLTSWGMPNRIVRPGRSSLGCHALQVAEIMGKLGGRSRQWLLDGLVNDYKPIPEYGLRVILAFSPRTSFLVPLDRCVQFAAAAIKSGAPSSHALHHQA